MHLSFVSFFKIRKVAPVTVCVRIISSSSLYKSAPDCLLQITMSEAKKAKTLGSWKCFWDLQCPYSKAQWANLPAIKKRFENDYEFEIHLTSLAFHPQAFKAQCAASLIERTLGKEAKTKFVNACFENQELYNNKSTGDLRPSQVSQIFANIAKNAGLLDGDDDFTEQVFLEKLDDWDEAVQPAWTEHKIALSYKVMGVPKNVINGVLIDDTESAWGAEEWAEKLKSIANASSNKE
jgi:hypothetical protein